MYEFESVDEEIFIAIGLLVPSKPTTCPAVPVIVHSFPEASVTMNAFGVIDVRKPDTLSSLSLIEATRAGGITQSNTPYITVISYFEYVIVSDDHTFTTVALGII